MEKKAAAIAAVVWNNMEGEEELAVIYGVGGGFAVQKSKEKVKEKC